MAMVGYIESYFPGIPAQYLPGEFPSPVVS